MARDYLLMTQFLKNHKASVETLKKYLTFVVSNFKILRENDYYAHQMCEAPNFNEIMAEWRTKKWMQQMKTGKVKLARPLRQENEQLISDTIKRAEEVAPVNTGKPEDVDEDGVDLTEDEPYISLWNEFKKCGKKISEETAKNLVDQVTSFVRERDIKLKDASIKDFNSYLNETGYGKDLPAFAWALVKVGLMKHLR